MTHLKSNIFVINTGSIFDNYHLRLNLHRILIFLMCYITHLLLTLPANEFLKENVVLSDNTCIVP